MLDASSANESGDSEGPENPCAQRQGKGEIEKEKIT